MRCPLCKSQVPKNTQRCPICDTDLTTQNNEYTVVDTIDASRTRFSAYKIFLVLTVVTLLVTPWLLMGDLFRVPPEVDVSREKFEVLTTRYQQSQTHWHAAKQQLLENMQNRSPEGRLDLGSQAYDNVPLEVFMAFLREDLQFSKDRFRDVTVFPIPDTKNTVFLITKYEKGVWPLKIVLSLEVQLINKGNRLSVEFRRLRRGSREISRDFAWVYFAPELKLLRQLEVLAGGVSNVHVYILPQPVAEGSQERLGWRYCRDGGL